MAKKAKQEPVEEIIETAEVTEKQPEPSVDDSVAEVAEDSADTAEEEPEAGTAKAGKRSAKAVREEEEETERKEKAAAKKEDPAASGAKPPIVHTPNPLKRHGKNYRAAAELVDSTKLYELGEALELTQKTSKVKFDASVELHANLGVDPRQADQMVRASVILPAGTGRDVRIAVVAPYEKHAEAKKAGADIVSDAALIAEIEKGAMDFDILIATPDMMPKLAKAAKVLGPRGLMPSPKSGTVTPNVASAVAQSKAGKVEFRIDKQAIVHLAIGKVSFKQADLEDNAKMVIDAIMKAKPASTKGTYVKSMSLTTSMGPGIKLDVTKAIAAANPKK